VRPTAKEGVKNSKTGNFTLCDRLKIHVGARHGVPLRGFFHSFESNEPLVARTMNGPALLEADEHA
jgi:hypothetical protein